MKPLVIILVAIAVFVAAAGGGYVWLKMGRVSEAEKATMQPVATQEEENGQSQASMHGKSVAIPPNAVVCAVHNVPEVVDPFCNAALIEELGYCGGHDVAEALCTRCNPIIIPAFKAENDWCAEHGLPESQCAICLGETTEGASS